MLANYEWLLSPMLPGFGAADAGSKCRANRILDGVGCICNEAAGDGMVRGAVPLSLDQAPGHLLSRLPHWGVALLWRCRGGDHLAKVAANVYKEVHLVLLELLLLLFIQHSNQ